MSVSDRNTQYNSDSLARSRYNGTAAAMPSNRMKTSVKKQNERALRRKFEKRQQRVSRLAVVIIAFVLLLLCVFEYSLVQNMGLQLNEQKVVLSQINAENEALKQQSAALSNKSVIQKKAEDNLGMQSAERVIVYTRTTETVGSEETTSN